MAGVCVQLAVFQWLAPAFAAYSGASLGVAWAGFALYVAWEAIPFAILGLVDWAIRRRCPRARWWLFAAAFVGVEWLWPRVFPWRAGAPQVEVAWIAPLAVLLGPLGLTLIVALVNGGLFESARQRRILPAAVVLGLLGATLAFGAFWSSQPASGPTVRVGWVQPGVVVRSGEGSEEVVWRALLEGCSAVGLAGGADVCVLPEGICPTRWMELDPSAKGPEVARWRTAVAREQSALVARLRALARAARAPVLIGITRRWVVPRGDDQLEVVRRVNACVLVGPEGIRAWTGKRRLLPFAEELPWEGLRAWIPQAGRYSSSPDDGQLEVFPGGAKAGVLVCYEATRARPFGANPPGVLLNPTNDDWFQGLGPAQHAMLCRVRAVEANRPLIRVASTGISYAISGRGALLVYADSGPASGVVSVRAGTAQTPHTRWGEGWAPALALLALALPLLAGRRLPAKIEDAPENAPKDGI